MADTNFMQNWQMVQDGTLPVLGQADRTDNQTIIGAMDATLDSPLRLFATLPADTKLNIAASIVAQGDAGSKSLPPVRNVLNSFVATTIDFQSGAVSGGTLTVEGGAFILPDSTSGNYRRLVLSFVYDGTINCKFSGEEASPASLPDPGTLLNTLGDIPLCYIDIKASGTYSPGRYRTANSASDIIENDSIVRFPLGGGGGGAGGSESLHDAYTYGGTITTTSGFGAVVIAGTQALKVTATDGLEVNTLKFKTSPSTQIAITAPSGAESSYILPTADGSLGNALITDGGGNLSWGSVAGNVSLNDAYGYGGTITTTSSLGAVVIDGTEDFRVTADKGATVVGNLVTGNSSNLVDPANTAANSAVIGGSNSGIGPDAVQSVVIAAQDSGIDVCSNSVIVGGVSNVIVANCSVVLGGKQNTISFINYGTLNSVVVMGAGAYVDDAYPKFKDCDLIIGNNPSATFSDIKNIHFKVGGYSSDIDLGRQDDQDAVAGASNTLKLHTINANNQQNYIGFKAKDNLTTSTTYAFPNDGSANQYLKTNSSGTLSFGTIDLASEISGILPVANGGTGSSSQNFVDLSTTQSVGGTKTFTSFPETPSSAPTTNYQVANKKYVDDQDTLKVNKAGDTMTGNLTLTSGAEILGLPLTPSISSAAASKAYVDAVAQGLSIKGPALVTTASADLSGITISGLSTVATPSFNPIITTISSTTVRISIPSQPFLTGDLLDVDNMEATGGISAGDINGKRIITSASTSWIEVSAGAAATTTASGGGLSGVLHGILVLTTSGSLSFDGLFFETDIVSEDRVLIRTMASGYEQHNGLFNYYGKVSNDYHFERAEDADNSPNAEVAGGMFVFVDKGTVFADTGFVLTSPHGLVNLGVDAEQFSQFSAAGSVDAGDGLQKLGSIISVLLDGDTLAASVTGLKFNNKLGANLNVNGYTITSQSDGDVVINPDGTGSTKISSDLVLEASDAKTVTLTVPSGMGSNYALTLPTSDGDALQFLQTDGSGVLSWSTVAASGANAVLSNLETTTSVNSSLVASGNNTLNLGSPSNGWAIAYANQLVMTSNSQSTTLKGSQSATASVVYSMPVNGGSVGQVLSSDGAGTLAWATPSGGQLSNWVVKTVADNNEVLTNGGRILADTTSGVFTLVLPASPTLGYTVEIVDAASTFGLSNLTVGRNGEKIQGVAEDFVFDSNNTCATFVYYNSTVGWDVQSGITTAIIGGFIKNWSFKVVGNNGDTLTEGDRILVDTTGGPFTLNLPAAPVQGTHIQIEDAANYCGTNILTINRNGNNILSKAENLSLEVNGTGVSMVYYNASVGWTVQYIS